MQKSSTFVGGLNYSGREHHGTICRERLNRDRGTTLSEELVISSKT